MHWNQQQTSKNWRLDHIKIWSREKNWWSLLSRNPGCCLLSNVSLVTRSCFSRTVHQRIGRAKRSNCWSAKPRLHLSGSVAPISPDLNLVDYKLWGSCNSGSIRRRLRMWINSRSDWLKSGLVWSRTLLTAVNEWRYRLRACVRAKGRHFEHFTVGSWTTGQLDKLSARLTEM